MIRLERPAVPEVLRSTGARLGLWNRRRTRAATPPELDQFLYGAEVFDALIAMSYTWENLLPARADRIRAKGNRFPIERPDRASRRRSPTTTSTSR